ncbi:hypothetical protein NGB36_03075 [Streptomyces sp. RB6PN25]|uniref:Uncharacterized protein n=1 Tax=Streptomyces humicola TaxID=2953240 RepID=A0ABT1PPK1_9ACTN|nr:hypothetical protein [Streptomyces humicola]MCQ4079606.1 hypothetical protein [Streptomyces humicola]
MIKGCNGRLLAVGDRVRTDGGVGTVMHAGMFKGAPGVWVRQPLAVPFNGQDTVTEILRPWLVEAVEAVAG